MVVFMPLARFLPLGDYEQTAQGVTSGRLRVRKLLSLSFFLFFLSLSLSLPGGEEGSRDAPPYPHAANNAACGFGDNVSLRLAGMEPDGTEFDGGDFVRSRLPGSTALRPVHLRPAASGTRRLFAVVVCLMHGVTTSVTRRNALPGVA